jgi:hypothetical protein
MSYDVERCFIKKKEFFTPHQLFGSHALIIPTYHIPMNVAFEHCLP